MYLSFSAAGVPVTSAVFQSGNNEISVLASLIYLCNRLFFDYTTKVHIILYYAIAVHVFLYIFNFRLQFERE